MKINSNQKATVIPSKSNQPIVKKRVYNEFDQKLLSLKERSKKHMSQPISINIINSVLSTTPITLTPTMSLTDSLLFGETDVKVANEPKIVEKSISNQKNRYELLSVKETKETITIKPSLLSSLIKN